MGGNSPFGRIQDSTLTPCPNFGDHLSRVKFAPAYPETGSWHHLTLWIVICISFENPLLTPAIIRLWSCNRSSKPLSSFIVSIPLPFVISQDILSLKAEPVNGFLIHECPARRVPSPCPEQRFLLLKTEKHTARQWSKNPTDPARTCQNLHNRLTHYNHKQDSVLIFFV